MTPVCPWLGCEEDSYADEAAGQPVMTCDNGHAYPAGNEEQ